LDAELIDWFWSIVRELSTEYKRRLLTFVTATDRIPVSGLESVTFKIQRNGVAIDDKRLPGSHTCYQTLMLPPYSSKEIMREKLMIALDNDRGFGSA
jgi:HECT-domain (ubiquitin-transferase)